MSNTIRYDTIGYDAMTWDTTRRGAIPLGYRTIQCRAVTFIGGRATIVSQTTTTTTTTTTTPTATPNVQKKTVTTLAITTNSRSLVWLAPSVAGLPPFVFFVVAVAQCDWPHGPDPIGIHTAAVDATIALVRISLCVADVALPAAVVVVVVVLFVVALPLFPVLPPKLQSRFRTKKFTTPVQRIVKTKAM